METTTRVRTARGLAAAVLVGASATLLGWFAGVEVLVRVHDDWPVTVPATALALALLAGVVLLDVDPERRRAARWLAATVAGLGALSLAHHLVGTGLVEPGGGLLPRVAEWQPGVPAPARPPLLTSVQLVVLGSFLLLEPASGRRVRLVLWGVATVAVAILATTLVGYLGGDPSVLQPGTRLSLPAATMVALLWGSVALQAAPRLARDHPERFGPSTRTLLRRVGLPLLLLPPLLAVVQLLAERTPWMDRTTTLATFSVVIALGAVAFVLAIGRDLDAAQRERQRTAGLLRGVVDALAEGLVVRDADGQVVLSNPAMSTVTGLDYGDEPALDEVATETAYRRADGTPELLPSVRAARDGTPVLGEVGTVTTPDGRVRWVRSNALPHRPLGPAGEHVSVTTITDVTEEQRTAVALAEAERRFRMMFDHAPIGLASVTPDGRFEEVNPAFCRLVGRDRDALVGTTFAAITHPDDLAADEALVAELAAGRVAEYQLDKRYLRPDGTEVWVALHASVLRDDDGSVQRFLAQVVDLSDRRRLEQLLTEAATHDPLTGLPNRRLLDDRLEVARARAQRAPDRRAALVFLDLDGFKAVNDAHGHEVGDTLLVTIAHRLREAVRDGDTVARFGGDEFVVLVDGLDEDDDLDALCARLRVAVTHPVPLAGGVLTPAASLGLHVYAPAETAPQEALRAADAAMYAAKRGGGGDDVHQRPPEVRSRA